MATNPFDVKQKKYTAFPNDEYVDVCVLSYQTADLPPGPMAETNDLVPNCRFLFGGYVKDESGQIKCDADGAPIIVRKWSNWMRISNNKRAKLMQVFDTTTNGFQNLFEILMDYENTNGKLWKTPMKILLEATDRDYQAIKRIKPGAKTELCDNVFYDDKYIPYKVIKAYGQLVPLTLAGCKFKSGVKVFTPEEMVEPTDEQ